MDFPKYPLEKLLYFIAAVVPGFVALLIYEVANPRAFVWFFWLGFLGYRSKLGVILLTAFVVGYSMISFLSSLLGAIGGAVGGVWWRPASSYDIAPWRDATWRAALSKHLEVGAPKDTLLMKQPFYELREQAISRLPEAQRLTALLELRSFAKFM